MPPTVRTGQKDLEARGRVKQGDDCQAVVPAGRRQSGAPEEAGQEASIYSFLKLEPKVMCAPGSAWGPKTGKDSEVLGARSGLHLHGSLTHGLVRRAQVPQVELGN